ncbi:hypothetical protein EDD17DRAFT_1539117 [Pisolithus thermaeus]|nr:hypothetical protein EV401DRAFT_2046188 [Pisolithus croceorrhizus]KAI6167228.1 hypothetical protein EDD17DRAFT_1539117 [Pisolithus thermaeus]
MVVLLYCITYILGTPSAQLGIVGCYWYGDPRNVCLVCCWKCMCPLTSACPGEPWQADALPCPMLPMTEGPRDGVGGLLVSYSVVP